MFWLVSLPLAADSQVPVLDFYTSMYTIMVMQQLAHFYDSFSGSKKDLTVVDKIQFFLSFDSDELPFMVLFYLI